MYESHINFVTIYLHKEKYRLYLKATLKELDSFRIIDGVVVYCLYFLCRIKILQ